jgi:superfamily II DNA or RNA helicase
MAAHDIIDNRATTLVDKLSQMLGGTEAARFAVGYFFVSGLEGIAKSLDAVKELRLLIGNTTNRETIEQLAEGRRRLELVEAELEAAAYPKRVDKERMTTAGAADVRQSLELADQTDSVQETVKTLVRLIEEKRLKVRVYTKGRMHAKAYILTYGDTYNLLGQPVPKHEKGIAVVGSSNLTLAGITHNTELNVVVQGNNNHDELVRWFDELWDEAQEFDEALMAEMKASWAMASVTPYDIYMKTLYALLKDRVEEADDTDVLWDDDIFGKLAKFQQDAVRSATRIIRDQRGAFVADVVGLGKSYIGAAIVKHFERTDHTRALILCPAPLVKMWERYNELYHLNANVLSMGFLYESEAASGNILLDDVRYRDRDFLLIDESHNLRNTGTQRYKLVQAYMEADPGRRCCLLTATPRNRESWDVFNQIKLFHHTDKTDLPIDPPDLRQYFNLIEKQERTLPELLRHLLIRRTRNEILRGYGFDSETGEKVDRTKFADYLSGKRRAYVQVAGKNQYFPRRRLKTVEYSIEDTYQGLYQELRTRLGTKRKSDGGSPGGLPKSYDGELTYARYGLFRYVKAAAQNREPYVSLQRAGGNLRGLMRVLLFKRFESSVYAFRETIGRLLNTHRSFLHSLELGFIPAGKKAQALLHASDGSDEADFLSALEDVSQTYRVEDFHVERLKQHIEHDIEVLEQILLQVEPIKPDQDAKLQKLLSLLTPDVMAKGKRLIFTQYADTARYLYDNLNPDAVRDDVDVIFSGDKSKFRIVGRFSPRSNPEYERPPHEVELNTVIATDVLSEGLNLQDCDTIINYDLHWNPVRLIQRFGRIDRIGSDHDTVYGLNFLPETGIEKNLGLREKLKDRIDEIHGSIGEDSAILDPSEQINEEAMYAIYEEKAENLGLFEEDELVNLNEAEEILRHLKAEDPSEYERIAALRDGIRSAKPSLSSGSFVFCQAGNYQQLYQLDGDGAIVTRDIPAILGAIKCSPSLPAAMLPKNHNSRVMEVRRLFDEEVKYRNTERQHSVSLSHGQKYVLRELRNFVSQLDDADERRAGIGLLDSALRSSSLTSAAKRELTALRRNNVVGEALFRSLIKIYDQHRLRDHGNMKVKEDEAQLPRIVCSEAMV